jgi:hypothetical protein
MGDPANDGGDWTTWKRLVLDKLDRLERGQTTLGIAVAKIDKELAVQKVKSGLLGAVAGACTYAIGYFAEHWILRSGR